jgi:hypothetical protein
MATKQSKTTAAKAAKTTAKASKKPATRAQRYVQVFTPSPAAATAGGFFQQVNGYGTPFFSEVSSHVGA